MTAPIAVDAFCGAGGMTDGMLEAGGSRGLAPCCGFKEADDAR